MRRAVALLVALCALAVTTTLAGAWWSAESTPGGGGSAAGATVHQGAAAAATAPPGGGVAVLWGTSTLSDGTPVDGYEVKRYDAVSGVSQPALGTCAGVVADTSCVEDVPPGDWRYSVTPSLAAWRGQEGLLSGVVTVGPATLMLADVLFGAPLPRTTSGQLAGFAANEGITYRMDASTPLAGSPSESDLAGEAAIESLTIPVAPDGPHTVYALGDALVAPSRASVGIVIDTVAPTASAQSVPLPNAAGWSTIAPVEVRLAGDGGSGTGLLGVLYTTNGDDPVSFAPDGTPTFEESAQLYEAPLSLGSTTTLKYVAFDLAMNSSPIQTHLVRIDTVPPASGLAVSDAAGTASKTADTIYYRGTVAGSFTLTNTVTDADSGPASSATSALTGNSTGWSHTPSSVSSPLAGGPYVSSTFAWTAGTVTGPTVTVTGSDAAGYATPATLTFARDVTAPSGGGVSYTDGAVNLLGVPVTTVDGNDGGSGIDSSARTLERDETTLTGGACGSFPGAYSTTVTLSGGYDLGVATGKCYMYRYLVVDNVGNQATYTSASVAKVETTPPVAASCYPSQVTADAPVSYWRLDETSGTTAVDTAGSNPGTYTGSPTLGSSGALAATSNKAVSLNGSTGRVEVPDSNSLDLNAFTVEAWVRPTSWGNTATWRTIVMKGTAHVDRNFGMWLAAGTNGSVSYSFGTSSGALSSATSKSQLRLGVWQHIAFVHVAGSKSRLYINGVLDSDNPTALTPATSAAPVSIGGPSSTYGWFTGGIDEVAVYNTALTDTRVRAQYNSGRCYRDEALAFAPAAYWRLGEAGGTATAFDFNAANNALFENNPALGVSGLIDGDTDTAVDFDGVDDRVKALPSASLDVPGAFSLEATIKPTSVTNSGYVLGNGEYQMYTVPNGAQADLVFAAWDSATGSWKSATAPLAVSAGLTYHLVGVNDGSALRIYKNGIQVASGTAPAAMASAPETTYIGSNGTTGFFAGRIDDLSIVSGALSAAWVRAHYYTSRAYREVILERAPARYWRFGETAGTATTDEIGAAAGSLTGGYTLGQPGAIAGDASSALTLDGTTGYVALPTGLVQSYNAGFTFEGWIYWRGTGHGQRIFHFGTDIQTYMVLSPWGDAEKLEFITAAGGVFRYLYQPATRLPTNTWIHVAVTLDGTTARLYLNGSEVASTPNTFLPSVMGATTKNWFGRSQFAADPYLNATVDEFALYGKALTANELQLHYEAGRDAPR